MFFGSLFIVEIDVKADFFAVVHYVISATYTVYRRIVNTPATAELVIKDKNEPAHCFAFFSASQKTLKFKLIR